MPSIYITTSTTFTDCSQYGFFNILLKAADDVKPDAIAVAFDCKAKTFRHKAVASYKANRKGMPEELHMQMAPLKELLTE